MIGAGAPHIPYPLVERALRTGNLPYLRRHSRQITLSLLDRIRLIELAADQEPAMVERDALDFIRQWTVEVPGAQLEDYQRILDAVNAVRHAPERAAAELEALCSARDVFR
jgi:hypothetical protein